MSTTRGSYPPTSPVATTPAKKGRFAVIKLSEERLDAYHNRAHEALSETVKEFTKLDGKNVDTNRWGYIRSRNDMSAYIDRRPFSDRVSSLLVAGTMKARLSDVMEGLYSDNSEDTRLVQNMVSPRFTDAEVLHVIEQRSIEQPYTFTGLKWSVIKASSGAISSSRDLTYIEKLGMICIGDGRKLGYFILQSVDLPECPANFAGKMSRGHISLCYLFEELAEEVVGVYMIGSIECNGAKFMTKIVRNSFADITLSFGNTVEIARIKRFTRLTRTKTLLPPGPSRPINCEVCNSFPSMFDHAQECAGCNKTIVCKRCRTKCDLFRRESDHSKRLAKAFFCRHCVTRVKSPLIEKKAVDKVVDTTAKPEASKPRESAEDVLGSSFATVSEDGCETEQLPASQRSLRRFSIKLLKELEDVGYSSSTASARLDGLSTLGSGHHIRVDDYDIRLDDYNDDYEDSDAVLSPMSARSTYSSKDYDEEDIISIKPVRRSLQPPEMLEAPLREQRRFSRSYTDNNGQRDLLSRFMQVARAAEETLQITREQTKHMERELGQSRVKA